MGEAALAYWAVGPGRGELRPVPLRPPGRDEVLVRTRVTAVSRGTESLVARGRVPPGQAAAMRAPFQEGAFPFPVKYGYCSVGVVETAGQDAGELLGRLVFCLHPHQSAFVVPAAMAVPVPDGVPEARAVLAANMETALNALWDAAALPGERIHVIGAGVVGCLAAYLCGRLPGAEVTLADVRAARASTADALGVGFAEPERLARDADLVLHASGQPGGLRRALEVAGPEARVVELSWYGTTEVVLPLGEAFHSRRLRLVSSQVGQVTPALRPRWSHRRRLAKALELLRDPALDALPALDLAFASLPETLPPLLAGGGAPDALLIRIVYPGSEAA